MTELPFMPMYWSDFLTDAKVRDLPGDVQGVYALVLGHMWLNGGWLPDDDRILAHRLNLDIKTWRARFKGQVTALLRREVDGMIGPIWRQSRLVTELAQARERVEKNKARTAAATAERLKKSTKGAHVTSQAKAARNEDRNVTRSEPAPAFARQPEPQEPPSQSDGGSGDPLTPSPARPPAVGASGLAGPFMPAPKLPPAPAGKTRFQAAWEAAQGDMGKLPVLPGAPVNTTLGHEHARSTWDAVNSRFVSPYPPPGTAGRDARQQAATQPAAHTSALDLSPLVKRMKGEPNPQAFAEEAKAALAAQQEEPPDGRPDQDPGDGPGPDDDERDDLIRF